MELQPRKRRRATIAQTVAFAILLVAPAGAQSADVITPALGPGFALLVGQSGQQGCLPRPLSQEVLTELILDQNDQLGIDPEIAVVLSLDVPTCGSIFYVPVQNDIRGIGYGHFFDTELFDNSPERSLQGIAFLNDLPYWEIYKHEWTRAFLHEVGHRWSARVRVAGEDSLALLGRDREHWSYFLTTGKESSYSPLEGNLWVEAGNGEFSTRTDEATERYSPLDLYLMGLLAPGEVGPLSVLVPTSTEDLVDCSGAPLSVSSPPQSCESLVLSADLRTYSIDDVIAVEGERTPAAESVTTPKSLTVGLYLLAPSGVPLSEERCSALSVQADVLMEAFEGATDSRMAVVNLTEGAATCEDLAQLTKQDEVSEPKESRRSDASCSFSPFAPNVPGLPVALSFALWLVRKTQWRHKTKARGRLEVLPRRQRPQERSPLPRDQLRSHPPDHQSSPRQVRAHRPAPLPLERSSGLPPGYR